jgi:cytochrome c-type biogenesis protein CcmE
MNPKAKFGILITVILGTLGWLAVSGVGANSSYYKTVLEVQKMGGGVLDKKLRVAGDVLPGSIERDGRIVRFALKEQAQTMKVVYEGIEPLPDTFRDNAQAVAEGRLGPDGVFRATKIQAKCASKYEKKYGERTEANKTSAPTY